MKLSFKIIVSCTVLLLGSKFVNAQNKTKEAEYRQVVTQRADKIVKGMNITDSVIYNDVRNTVADQYVNLSEIHDSRNAKIKATKEKYKEDKDKSEAKVKKLEMKADKQLARLHKQYISKLSENLSPEQVDQVKDGMTYNVLPNTYRAYQEMLPNLTVEQKKQILAWLTEAREHAIDAESSDKKHAWFGKYKGKINNYLSKAGIDMNKEGKDWQERIKAAKDQEKAAN